jgi:hypothetical protein
MYLPGAHLCFPQLIGQLDVLGPQPLAFLIRVARCIGMRGALAEPWHVWYISRVRKPMEQSVSLIIGK